MKQLHQAVNQQLFWNVVTDKSSPRPAPPLPLRCEVKVIDLGSSCFITDHLSSYVQSRSYRAPEVILGLAYGQKIDIWSLGCILAELATGYVLFQVFVTPDFLADCVSLLAGPCTASASLVAVVVASS